MDDETEDRMRKLVHSAVDPIAVFQRQQCRALVNEFYRRFGPDVLIDILVAVDATEHIASAVVADKAEVENYVFAKYGIYDENMFMKIQLTSAWERFQDQLMELSGQAAAEAVDEVLASET